MSEEARKRSPVSFETRTGNESIPEDLYGTRKRLQFAKDLLSDVRPRRVMDVGCGTGANLTIPLARHFPEVSFWGVDADIASVDFAKGSNELANVRFALPEEVPEGETFDLIIASEVVEHVDKPAEFLFSLRDKLTDSGKVLLTLPNGYGPFEAMSFLDALLRICRIRPVLRRVKRAFTGSSGNTLAGKADTLAVSPHVNFFSHRQICQLAAEAGLTVEQYRPRTLLCGFIFDELLGGARFSEWNARVCDRLPPFASSAWMFVLAKGDFAESRAFRRSAYARIRGWLNEKAPPAQALDTRR
ncbi:MAG: hypothetical protein A2Z18_05605 [Armatimonadetes bacterium RBG_16_58_9]|nr:MAG: hypothetical protein A2Z18_05605 [Armatimonadetes bacterium RBG_16_58_9]